MKKLKKDEGFTDKQLFWTGIIAYVLLTAIFFCGMGEGPTPAELSKREYELENAKAFVSPELPAPIAEKEISPPRQPSNDMDDILNKYEHDNKTNILIYTSEYKSVKILNKSEKYFSSTCYELNYVNN